MRFLESASRRRVSRRENAAELGLRAKFVVYYSVAIASSERLRGDLDLITISPRVLSPNGGWSHDC
jgi:hypothetical protein